MTHSSGHGTSLDINQSIKSDQIFPISFTSLLPSSCLDLFYSHSLYIFNVNLYKACHLCA